MNARPVRPLREAIDACRFDSHDLQDPRFAELAAAVREDAEVRRRLEHVQQLDARIAQAFQDVEIPSGLEGRLLDALALGERPIDAQQQSDEQYTGQAQTGRQGDRKNPVSLAASPSSTRVRRLKMDRRAWVWAMGVAGTIAAALLIGIWLTGRPAVRTDVLVGWARAWVSSVPDDPKSWRPLGRADMADYPVWRSIRPVPRGWQLISTELSHRTAVYDIAGSGRRGRALLFVANTRRDVRNLPTSPPSQPQHPTGDWLVAAWRSGQRVYILAFEGAPGRYQELVGNASNLVASDNRARSASLTAIDDPPAALFAQIAVAMNDPR